MPDITKKEKKRLYDIEYRKANKNKISFKNKLNYESVRKKKFIENPQHYLWYVARTRARKYKTEFNIEESDIIIPIYCPILNCKLEKGDGYLPNAMSLDRVDNNKGYIKGNIRVISRKANLLKSSLTLEVLENIIKYIKNEI
jgi:hypothetical protein